MYHVGWQARLDAFPSASPVASENRQRSESGDNQEELQEMINRGASLLNRGGAAGSAARGAASKG